MLRIKSDKTIAHIMDSETGDRVKGIASINIVHNIGSRPDAELTILSAEPAQYDVEVNPKFLAMSTVTGEMKEVKTIEFADGEIINYPGG